MNTCIECSKEFIAKRSTARFCSAACRVKNNRVSVTTKDVSVTKPVTLRKDAVTLRDTDTVRDNLIKRRIADVDVIHEPVKETVVFPPFNTDKCMKHRMMKGYCRCK